jgi:hypothetical protein
MPKNKYERDVKNTNPLAPDTITFPGDGGVFGANPAPGFNKYPETPGNVLPPTKFAETDIAPTQGTSVNNMHRDVEVPSIAEAIGLQKPGTTRIITGRNRYETEVKTNSTGKG